jgi:hypothetical protein
MATTGSDPFNGLCAEFRSSRYRYADAERFLAFVKEQPKLRFLALNFVQCCLEKRHFVPG